jgi:polyribonucleotide nucleotidyltransferase
VLAITGGPSAALAAVAKWPFTKTIAGVRVGLINGSSHVINPTHERAQTERARPDCRRQQRRHRHGRSGRATEVLEAAGRSAPSRPRTPRIKQIVAAIDDLQRSVNKKKLPPPSREVDHAFHAEAEKKMFEPLATAMRIKDKLESYGTVDTVLSDFVSGLADDDSYAQRKAEAKHVFHTLKEKVLRDEVLNKAFASTAGSSTRSGQSGRKPACSPACTAL